MGRQLRWIASWERVAKPGNPGGGGGVLRGHQAKSPVGWGGWFLTATPAALFTAAAATHIPPQSNAATGLWEQVGGWAGKRTQLELGGVAVAAAPPPVACPLLLLPNLLWLPHPLGGRCWHHGCSNRLTGQWRRSHCMGLHQAWYWGAAQGTGGTMQAWPWWWELVCNTRGHCGQ